MLDKVLVLLIIGKCLLAESSGQSWEGNCKYYFGNGSFIDLSPLDVPASPV